MASDVHEGQATGSASPAGVSPLACGRGSSERHHAAPCGRKARELRVPPRTMSDGLPTRLATRTALAATAAAAPATTAVPTPLGRGAWGRASLTVSMTPAECLLVQLRDRRLCFGGAGHFDKREATRAPGLPIANEAHRGHRAGLGEVRLEIRLVGVERKVADVQLDAIYSPAALKGPALPGVNGKSAERSCSAPSSRRYRARWLFPESGRRRGGR